MPSQKQSVTLRKALSVIRKEGRYGIQQKEVEVALGISKSYCSEIISTLERTGSVRRVEGHGNSVVVYSIEYFPGQLDDALRIGLLKSSEYIPILTLFLSICASRELRPLVRFYNGTRELLNDLRFHSIDFCLAPTLSLVQSAALGGEIKVLTGLASGGSGVVEKNGTEKLEILSTEASSMVSMAPWGAGKESLSGIRSYENPVDGLRKFRGGMCGRIAIWEPYFSKLLSEPTNHPLLRYEDVLDNFPCCSIATSGDFYRKNQELTQSFSSEYVKLDLRSLKRMPDFSKALGILARVTKLTKGFIEKTLDSYNFKSTLIRRSSLSRLGISLSLRQEKEIFLPGCLSED